MKTINVPDLVIDFYEYEFDNNIKSFKISKINKVNVSFKITGKWYRLFIYVEGVFTGRYLNLISARELDNYSVRYEIGIAYRNYLNGLFYDVPDVIETSNTPQTEIPGLNRFVEKQISVIKKYSSRDELSNLKLV